MKAIVITKFGGPEVLQIQERPLPTIGEDEVLIKVKAAGVNRPDVFQRKGNYPAPADAIQDIPGLEIAGEVQQVGAKVSTFNLGDRVCCLLAGGGYAEYVSVHVGMCMPIPDGFSFEEAAALPEAVFTVWDNVFRRGLLQPCERVLIHGGSGGIGTTAIQLCKAVGAEVYTTAGSAKKLDYCKQLGADHILNYKEYDFAQKWKGEDIHVVLDSIGGDYFNKHIAILAEDGKLVHINAVSGAEVNLNILKLMQKRIVITGSTLRPRSQKFKIQLTEEVQKQVWPLMGKKIVPNIYTTFPLEKANAAHELLESGIVCGKLVLTI